MSSKFSKSFCPVLLVSLWIGLTLIVPFAEGSEKARTNQYLLFDLTADYTETKEPESVTPADKYFGRDFDILKNREKVRKQTMKLRRKLNRMAVLQTLPNGIS